MISINVNPIDLRDYAKALGWQMVPAALRDRLYVLNHASFTHRQLVFPMDADAPDYAEACENSVQRLAELHSKSNGQVLRELLNVRNDLLRMRIGPNSRIRTLPLSYAVSAVSAARQILLSSACSVVRPRSIHPRLTISEAQQLVDRSKFDQTEEGSFILNIACPLNAVSYQPALDEGVSITFVRKALILAVKGMQRVVHSIERDEVDVLVQDVVEGTEVHVSANLCDALSMLRDESADCTVEVGVLWSPDIPRPHDLGSCTIKLQDGYFEKIDDIRDAIRSREGYKEDQFVGTVERLDGSMGSDGRRSGEVVFALMLRDGETIRARANLTADQYADADRAHMNDGMYVQVAGRLHPGRQPRSLTNISSFALLPMP